MAFLAAVLPYLALAGGAVSAIGQAKAGKEAKQDAYNQAAQLDDQANLVKADAQRQAIEERRQASRAASRALAVAGASGAGALDPTVQTITSRIEGEGEYRALSRLFNGDSEAANLKDQAAATRRTGKAQQRAGRYAAVSTVLSSGSDFASKYGKVPKKKASYTASFDADTAGDYELTGSTRGYA